MNVETLIEDYKRRFKTIKKEIAKGGNDITLTRLGTKASEYQTFIAELGKLKELNSYPDLSEATEEQKESTIKAIVEMVSKPLLSVFLAFGLKTHIETMIVNDATKEEYVLTFQTAKHFREHR